MTKEQICKETGIDPKYVMCASGHYDVEFLCIAVKKMKIDDEVVVNIGDRVNLPICDEPYFLELEEYEYEEWGFSDDMSDNLPVIDENTPAEIIDELDRRDKLVKFVSDEYGELIGYISHYEFDCETDAWIDVRDITKDWPEPLYYKTGDPEHDYVEL